MEIKELEKILQEKLALKGYDLVELVSRYEKGEHLLSVVIDRVEPIDMDTIVEVSHYLNEVIDEIDPFVDPYTLDISSLGAEKPLDISKLDSYISSYVHVHLINPVDGENIYEGTLASLDGDSIKIEYRIKTRTKTVDILKANISKIRLAIKF